MIAATEGPARAQSAGGGAWRRLAAVVWKEFIQMRRDRLTFAMMVGIPLMQLLLFGYAINTDPRGLPTAVLSGSNDPWSRAVVSAMQNTGYFQVTHQAADGAELDRLVAAGTVQLAIEIPASFGRDLVRGRRPQLLVVADATDPSATGGALSTLRQVVDGALTRDLAGATGWLKPADAPFAVTVHRRYNPSGRAQLNIVPGLLGIVLTMTMLIFTALSVTREVERGTMESLLSTPVRPVEIMLGKILPYVGVGFVQMTLILCAAAWLFQVPVHGSLALLIACTTLFVIANLSIGYTFSTVAQNQLQAVQMSFFFFLPNILLSGFMFPFRGMPDWAQWIGEVLPLTHFLRITRGIMLKGTGFADFWPDLAALGAFTVAVLIVALLRFRRTLD